MVNYPFNALPSKVWGQYFFKEKLRLSEVIKKKHFYIVKKIHLK